MKVYPTEGDLMIAMLLDVEDMPVPPFWGPAVFTRAAWAMRNSAWWTTVSPYEEPKAVSGEIPWR